MEAILTKIYDDNNVFAKILRNEIPSAKVFENDDVLVFMDAMPQTTGHSLVIPKNPSRNLLDADPETLSKLIQTVQIVAKAAKSAFNADGISIMQFNETAGGQSVFHLHFHVLPRFDGVALKPHSGTMEKPEILAENAEKLRKALSL